MSPQSSWYYENHAIFQAIESHMLPDLSVICDGSVRKVGGGYI